MTTDTRLQRAVKILTIQELKESGYWIPCEESGEAVDEKKADYVRCTVDGKTYMWNQHKRIREHEAKIKRDLSNMIGTDNTELHELHQLIDRLYDVIDRLEKLNIKAS